jgi:enoyl-CoA hydratase/carnithine racemase
MQDDLASHVRLERDAGTPAIATLTLSNPGRLNALTRAMWRELRDALDGLAAREPELRCVIVRGAGGQFAAGADLEEFPSYHFDAASARHFHETEPGPALHALLDCEIPLVAQIDGVCVGGGLEIAACCDLRIAGRSSRFGAPIARLGFPMAPDELELLLGLFGRATMAEILIQARLFDADEALTRRLVHQVVDDDQVAAEARRTAEQIAALPGQAMRVHKRTLRQVSRGGLNEAERREHFRYADGAEHHEAVQRFLARRR